MRIKIQKIPIQEIAFAMDGIYNGTNNPAIEYITTDSRKAESGDLYIPLKGKRFNGEDYVLELIGKNVFTVSELYSSAQIKVKSTTSSLLNFASYYSQNLPFILYKIGITGSVGKTTTKEFTKILFSTCYKTHANQGNFNNEIGLPISLLSAPIETEALILELGMNHRGEIERLSKCLCPDAAIITNIGSAHIGNLGSREEIANAKKEITEGMTGGKVYIPREEKLLYDLKNKVTVSIDSKDADYYLESLDERISIYKGGTKYTHANFVFKEPHLKKCLIFACALAIDCGIPPDILSKGISSISKYNIRQTIITKGDYLFYTDFYNASPESILASYNSIKNIPIINKKHLLLGDVLELGKMSQDIHYKIGQSIPKDLFDEIFLFGDFAHFTKDGAIESGFSESKIHINSLLSMPELTAMQIKKYCKFGDLILMKASRGIRLERVLDFFE